MLSTFDTQSQAITVVYSVHPCDTFYKISRYFNITLEDLLESNPGLDPDTLAAGQNLNIPLAAPRPNSFPITDAYIIQPGDTMYKISQRFNIKITLLLKANPHVNPDAPLAGQILMLPRLWNLYSNKEYKIEFKYPLKWAKINERYFEGVDGFFKLQAFNCTMDLEEFCKGEAFHKLKPYGTQPEIFKTTLLDNEACLLLPSSDQQNEMKQQALLVLKYPAPISIKDNSFSHLMLWSDTSHLKEIMDTLVLLNERL